ncbi:MAG: DNA primase noncatalytic subunit PriX [Candidatus Micrarchaeota archaeon]|nr:DNA primase noncatalytic subunit PriX [Candidatus Micrarchaeota archaeon]
MNENTRLDIAYRYPFSKVAKEVVAEQPNQIERKYLGRARDHLDQAVNGGLSYTDVRLSYPKLDYVMTYLYSRMMLSALKDRNLIRAYARAEGARSAQAAGAVGVDEVIKVCNELGVEVGRRLGQGEDDATELAVRFEQYIRSAPRRKGYELVNQRLGGGAVILVPSKAMGLLAEAAAREIMKGLPIRAGELPAEIVEYCKGVRIKIKGSETAAKRSLASESWIEDLLKTPIPDVRHRTVNLILAPYLVNSKGLDVEQATKVIVEYIERCKEIEPNTKVNERYIEYQCNYAKRRGLKPLSRERAKELLQGSFDL